MKSFHLIPSTSEWWGWCGERETQRDRIKIKAKTAWRSNSQSVIERLLSERKCLMTSAVHRFFNAIESDTLRRDRNRNGDLVFSQLGKLKMDHVLGDIRESLLIFLMILSCG